MSCIKPVVITNKYITRLFRLGKLKYNNLEVPCGKCLNCRIVKESQLTYLSNRELNSVYRSGRGASFVTLTYDDAHIPVNDKGKLTLRKRDFQLFMKNLRRNMEYHNDKTPFKVVYCGEYGDKFGRPHYHVCFLGLTDTLVKKYTRKLWKFGLCDVGALSNGGLRYVCKYMTKQNPSKKVKQVYIDNGCELPFIHHSVGLGKEWIIQNWKKIAENGFKFNIGGKQYLFPKYILKWVSLRAGVDYRPYVQQFINKESFSFRLQNKCDVDEWSRYQSEVKYYNNVQCMRQKGIAVDDELCRKVRNVRPYHHFDRKIDDLADKALYMDVVPF